jgi:hypothetical protein
MWRRRESIAMQDFTFATLFVYPKAARSGKIFIYEFQSALLVILLADPARSAGQLGLSALAM